MMDVVSHEFFHILTFIHSKVQDFDYNAPRCHNIYGCMKGVTEYFANLFQINQVD
jgi:predicted metalloprotease with PDZ domain